MSSHAPSRSVTPPWQLTVALAVALLSAGVIHFLLTPEHMELSVVFGAGFLAAGIAQFSLAVMAIVRPSRVVYAGIIAATLGLTSLYGYNVVVGLPFHDADEPSRVVLVADEHASDTGHGHAGEAAGEAQALSGDDHHDAGLVIGAGEPIDQYGAATQLAQLSAAALALTLLVRRTRTTT